MADRFYVPGAWTKEFEIDGTEAHHLIKVLRAKAGLEIEVFNGEGKSATATLLEVGKRALKVRLSSEVTVTPPSLRKVILAVASPKGERMRWMIEKVTELGVDRLIPLKTTRSVSDPGESKLSKLEQNVIAACKQSKRSRLLEIDEVCGLAELPNRVKALQPRYWVGDQSGGALPALSVEAGNELVSVDVAIIGPEGGFTSQEQEMIQSWGAACVSFSPYILRVETAAIAFATQLQNRACTALSAEANS